MKYNPTSSEARESKQARDTLIRRYHLTYAQAELWLETGEKESPEVAREALRSITERTWELENEDRWEGVLEEVYQ